MLDVPQHKNFAVFLPKRRQRLHQALPDLTAFQSLRRNLAPIGEVARRIIALLVLMVHDWLHDPSMLFPPPHAGLVDRDLDQPGAESRLATELPNMLESFQHRLLGYVFRIRLVAHNRECRGVHAPFVGSNQLIEELVFAVPDAPDQHFFIKSVGWILQRNRFSRHQSPPQYEITTVPNYFDEYSGSFFQPVSMETKLFHPCRTTITRWPNTKARMAHIIMKCHSRAQ